EQKAPPFVRCRVSVIAWLAAAVLSEKAAVNAAPVGMAQAAGRAGLAGPDDGVDARGGVPGPDEAAGAGAADIDGRGEAGVDGPGSGPGTGAPWVDRRCVAACAPGLLPRCPGTAADGRP